MFVNDIIINIIFPNSFKNVHLTYKRIFIKSNSQINHFIPDLHNFLDYPKGKEKQFILLGDLKPAPQNCVDHLNKENVFLKFKFFLNKL